jgi:hypothetical protein
MVTGRFRGAAFRICEQPSDFFFPQNSIRTSVEKYKPRNSEYLEGYISETSAAILRYNGRSVCGCVFGCVCTVYLTAVACDLHAVHHPRPGQGRQGGEPWVSLTIASSMYSRETLAHSHSCLSQIKVCSSRLNGNASCMDPLRTMIRQSSASLLSFFSPPINFLYFI